MIKAVVSRSTWFRLFLFFVFGFVHFSSLAQLSLQLQIRPSGERDLTVRAIPTNTFYAIRRSLDLETWDFLVRDKKDIDPTNWTDSAVLSTAFYSLVEEPEFLIQSIDDFAWPLAADPGDLWARGYRFYSRLNGDRGEMGNGIPAHGMTISNGVAHFVATSSSNETSWMGAWFSLSHTAAARDSAVDFAQPLPSPIKPEYQMPITAVSVRLRGNGFYKIELKGPADNLLKAWSSNVLSSSFVEIKFDVDDVAALDAVKLLTLVVESPSDIEVDSIGFVHRSSPALRYDDLLYGFVTTYGALLRCYDPASGRTRDHAQWVAGEFDSIPGCGFQALSAAMAWDLGIIAKAEAVNIASQSIQALTNAPRSHGLLPHWLKNGQIHPNSEYSSIDTALALWSALLASLALDMPTEQTSIRGLIDEIDWAVLTTISNTVAHGFYQNGQRIPHAWTDWGGETSLLQLLRFFQNPEATVWNYTTNPPAFGGRGFITELAALFFADCGFSTNKLDRFGVDWRAERQRQLALQIAYWSTNHPGSVAATFGLYGLSPVEIIDSFGTTSYLEGGIGAAHISANDGGGWIAGHYAAMSASLNPGRATRFVDALRQLGVWQPLIGAPEALLASNAGNQPARWHSVQVSLNEFFTLAGLYHAIKVRAGQSDLIYSLKASDPRLATALQSWAP